MIIDAMYDMISSGKPHMTILFEVNLSRDDPLLEKTFGFDEERFNDGNDGNDKKCRNKVYDNEYIYKGIIDPEKITLIEDGSLYDIDTMMIVDE